MPTPMATPRRSRWPPDADGRGLPPEDPDGEGLRRRCRDGARARSGAVAPPRQHSAPEARGPAERLLVQAPRRLQQDGASHIRRARARRHRRLRRQSRAGRRAGRAEARLRGDDRGAGDYAPHQDRGDRGARREGRVVRRFLQRRVRACALAAEALPCGVRASIRRSRCHRGPRHDRHGDPAAAPGPPRRDLRGDRRRRARERNRRVREARAARGQGDRSAARGFGRDGALDRGRTACQARARGPVRRRRGGQAGRQGDLSPRPAIRGRDRARRHGRHLRRAEGRFRGHALHPRARRRPLRRRSEVVGRTASDE